MGATKTYAETVILQKYYNFNSSFSRSWSEWMRSGGGGWCGGGVQGIITIHQPHMTPVNNRHQQLQTLSIIIIFTSEFVKFIIRCLWDQFSSVSNYFRASTALKGICWGGGGWSLCWVIIYFAWLTLLQVDSCSGQHWVVVVFSMIRLLRAEFCILSAENNKHDPAIFTNHDHVLYEEWFLH